MGKKVATDERSLLPNDNDPASNPPASVGPPSYVPGEAGAVVFVDEGPPAARQPPPRAAPWSGWPAEWDTPSWWGHLNMLTDTAWACLDLNSSVMATMPPYLVGASPNLPHSWFENPDPDLYTSWEEFAKQLFWDYQLGEAFVLATARYGDGWPARFHVVPPWTVQADISGDGTRRYQVGSVDVTSDMLHIRYRSAVGDAHGHGPLEAGRARLVAGRVLTQYATNLAETGAIPNAVLTHPDELTAEQATDLQTRWVEARLSKMGLPAVLSGGITFEALQLSPKDMALIELWQFNESRIAILLGVPPFLMGLPSGGDAMTYCLSDDTEILTRRGWLTCDEVTTADIALTLDHDTGLSEWQPVQAVNVFDVEEPMLRIDSRAHQSLSTLNHRWPVVKRNGERIWIRSDELNGEHQLVLAARCLDLPAEPKYTDAFVELVAWFTTEGYLNQSQGRRSYSTIGQSSERNPTNVEAIRTVLTELLGPARVKGGFDRVYVSHFGDEPTWVEDHNSDNGMISFRLNHEATQMVLSAIDGDPKVKAVSVDFLLSLTYAQLHLFIDTCVAGDGSTTQGRGSHRVFIQKDPTRIERFRLACTLAGIATSVYPRTGSDCVTVGIKKRVTYNPTRGQPKPTTSVAPWKGRVWCPTTANATWYARCNDREFFTGNTNVNALFDYHWRASLRPKAATVTAALSAWLTPRSTRLELNRDSYVQADPLVRAQVYEILNRIRDDLGRPVLTVDQIQTAERLGAPGVLL